MRFTVLASAALLSACLGQSGSEVIKPPTRTPTPMDPDPHPIAPGIPPQPHCPCDGLRDQQQIRATVLGVEGFATITNLRRYALRAEEVLSDAQSGEASLQPGDRFGGYWQGELACGGELQAPIAVGTQVLAFYRRGWQDGELCCDYIACGDDCPTEQEGDDDKNPASSPHEACLQQCRTQTAGACAEHREEAVMHGDLMLMPWGDDFVVGVSEHGQATITESDLHALTFDRDACMSALDDRFDTLHPPEPPSQSADEDDSKAVPQHPTPSTPPAQSPPASNPATPMTLPQTPPPPSAATPPATPPGTNTSSQEVGAPPAHPEEFRVRCRVGLLHCELCSLRRDHEQAPACRVPLAQEALHRALAQTGCGIERRDAQAAAMQTDDHFIALDLDDAALDEVGDHGTPATEFVADIGDRPRDDLRLETVGVRAVTQGLGRHRRRAAREQAARLRPRGMPIREHHRERGRAAVVTARLLVERHRIDGEPAELVLQRVRGQCVRAVGRRSVPARCRTQQQEREPHSRTRTVHRKGNNPCPRSGQSPARSERYAVIPGRMSRHGVASSSCAAIRTSSSSRPIAAANCTPIGRPLRERCNGSEIAG